MFTIVKKTVLFSALASFTLGFGQSISPKAKSILEGVAANYKAKKNNSFTFSYGTGSGKVTSTETGRLYTAGSKYKLTVTGVEQIYDGNKVYNIDKSDQEVTITKPAADEQLFSPLSYLDSYKKGYTVQYIGKKTVNGISTDHIKMTPTSNNGIKYVNLYVNSAKKELVKLEQVGTNNSVAVISIQKYQSNLSLPASTFSFNKALYKNYLITDL